MPQQAIDIVGLIQRIEAFLAANPQLSQALAAVFDALLAALLAKKGGVYKCPSGDCTDVVCHLDNILAASTQQICEAICAKSLCCQQQP